ncbi:nuclear transport factor 2 family protein [Pseudacidovorax sp. RU35E]|uniref:nuclear transport factor 2 family protein n=1 Tax=Pseudacidovorax sp. RU35E TaxID=1907403 RepID=UPI0009562C80|nr:nuclear transport factor 2 family protein [Pseudacidovorax sp. RU35E]SIR51932.1 SnoaL-like domain-containing protein [Pseudacidovorax sp. RU35E]
MIDPNTLARDYLAVWNDADDASRDRRLAANWRADACYADPMMQGEGRDGIATMISAARTQFPGHAFTLRGTPDTHGHFVRFSWTLAPDGGSAVAAGTDVVRLDAEGHIAEVIGFLDGSAA